MPKVTDTEATKERICAGAWRVIASEGIEAATLRRVASEVGCTTGLITHYFADKSDLVTFAYRRVLDEMISGAADAIARHDDVLRKVLAAIEAIEPTTPVTREMTVVLLNFWAAASFNPTYAAHCRDDYRRWRSMISDALRDGVAGGQLRADTDVSLLTDLLTLVSDGLSVGMSLTRRAYPPKRRRELVVALLSPWIVQEQGQR